MRLLREREEQIYEDQDVEKYLSRTFDRREIRRRSKLLSSSYERPLGAKSSLEQSGHAKIFSLVCNRFQKAQAAKLYQKMIKFPSMRADGDLFFSMFHLKLSNELTLQEFLEAMRKLKEPKNLKIMQRKKTIDSGKTNTVKKHSIFESTLSPEMVQRIMNKYDTNHDGSIDLAELKAGLKNILTKKTIQSLFIEYDVDKDKMLNRNEVIRLFSSNLN